VLAAAPHARMNVEAVSALDLSCAPAFATASEAVQITGQQVMRPPMARGGGLRGEMRLILTPTFASLGSARAVVAGAVEGPIRRLAPFSQR